MTGVKSWAEAEIDGREDRDRKSEELIKRGCRYRARFLFLASGSLFYVEKDSVLFSQNETYNNPPSWKHRKI